MASPRIKFRTVDGELREYGQIVCAVEDRDDITGEPSLLRPIRADQEVDLRECNQFVIAWVETTTFEKTVGND